MDEFYDTKSNNDDSADDDSVDDDSADDDSADDDSADDDSADGGIINDILKNPHFKNDRLEMHQITSDNLLKIEKHWSYNRKLDPKHYEKISDDLQKMKIPYFIGSIKIVKDAMNNFRIIDGQHRIKAIHEVKLNNSTFNMDIQIEVYLIADCNYDSEISSLFKLANSNKNVSDSDIPNDIIIKSIDILKTRHFPKRILDKEKGKRANHPNITTTELYECIKESNIIIEYGLDEKKLINAIVNYNIKCGASTFEELFPINNKKNKELFRRAKRNKFFLGLKRAPDRSLLYEWIYDIKKDLKVN